MKEKRKGTYLEKLSKSTLTFSIPFIRPKLVTDQFSLSFYNHVFSFFPWKEIKYSGTYVHTYLRPSQLSQTPDKLRGSIDAQFECFLVNDFTDCEPESCFEALLQRGGG